MIPTIKQNYLLIEYWTYDIESGKMPDSRTNYYLEPNSIRATDDERILCCDYVL